ncbi:MAG: hypothetical protein ACP5N2_03565 [Candidatus Nanoarchaeia archaeon]
MVENALKKSENSIIKIAELKRKLPKQINHNVLKTILEYLEQSNKIIVTMRGITWVYAESEKMKQAIKKGYSYPEDFTK